MRYGNEAASNKPPRINSPPTFNTLDGPYLVTNPSARNLPNVMAPIPAMYPARMKAVSGFTTVKKYTLLQSYTVPSQNIPPKPITPSRINVGSTERNENLGTSSSSASANDSLTRFLKHSATIITLATKTLVKCTDTGNNVPANNAPIIPPANPPRLHMP